MSFKSFVYCYVEDKTILLEYWEYRLGIKLYATDAILLVFAAIISTFTFFASVIHSMGPLRKHGLSSAVSVGCIIAYFDYN